LDSWKNKNIRHVSTTGYILAGLASSMMVNTTTPIANGLSDVYDVSLIYVIMCSVIFYAVHLPMAFLANYILDTCGL
jgi:hypothetical protein